MVDIHVFNKPASEFSGDAIVCFGYAEGLRLGSGLKPSGGPSFLSQVAAWDKKLNGRIFSLLKEEGSGAAGNVLSIDTLGHLPVRAMVWVGLGEESACKADTYKDAIYGLVRLLEKQKAKKVLVMLPRISQFSEAQLVALSAEALKFGGYHFTRYLSEKKNTDMDVSLQVAEGKRKAESTQALNMGNVLAECSDLARDLANEPSNVLYPEAFAQIARKEVGKIPGLTCRVLNFEEIKKKGMGLLAGVGQGSTRKPCLVVVEYRGGKKKDLFEAFVGKGITFDSGGISLKTGEAAYLMSHMKRDMAGAACVLGVMRAIALLKLPMNAVGVMSMAENMPDGGSHKPGDILKSLSGKTVEVYHTDAEGRLVIADGLAYAQQNYSVSTMIDIATLTGEVMRVFGPSLTAVFANRNPLYRDLKRASVLTGESIWRMPLFQPYVDKVKGAFADLRELNFDMPNAIASALFLQQFVNKDVSWAHLDIAGTEEYTLPQGGKGSTGSAVRLLAHYLLQKYPISAT